MLQEAWHQKKKEREIQKTRGRGLEKRRIKEKPDGLEDSGRRVRRALPRTAAIMSGEIGGFSGSFAVRRDHPKVASGIQV